MLPHVSANREARRPRVHRSLNLAKECLVGRSLWSARHEDLDEPSSLDGPAECLRRARVLYLDRIGSDFEAGSGSVRDYFGAGVVLHGLTSRIDPRDGRNPVVVSLFLNLTEFLQHHALMSAAEINRV